MTDRFPLAFSTLGCPNWTLEQAAAQAEQNGYQALEVRLLDGEIIPVDLPPQRRVEIKRALSAPPNKNCRPGLVHPFLLARRRRTPIQFRAIASLSRVGQ